ncbi:hypothetical protein YC2023_088997 [Brassica napus]
MDGTDWMQQSRDYKADLELNGLGHTQARTHTDDGPDMTFSADTNQDKDPFCLSKGPPRRPLERLTSRHREQPRPSSDDAVHDHRRDDQRSYHRFRKLDDRFGRNQQYDDCAKRLLPPLQVVEES